MAKKTAKKKGTSKRAAKPKVEHISHPKTSDFVREHSQYLVWFDREQKRLAEASREPDYEKRFKLFEKEAAKRCEALVQLHTDSQKEMHRFSRREYLESIPMLRSLTHTSTYELTPFRTSVSSSNMWQCPDTERWSAWFNNGQASLSQHYRLWFPERAFTGKFEVSVGLSFEGLVVINPGGKVQVDAACYVTLVECNADDPNHDNGWHYDSNYDTYIRDWRSYCDGTSPLSYVDTLPGLHTFRDGRVNVYLNMECGNGASNRFIEVTQDITITATNAWAQFGPSRSDCAQSVGWIRTPYPTVRLEFFNLLARPRLVEENPWENLP
ncbi:MAG: hypothetical protein JSV31_31640 [Desulfobacterales bacterium]|nr:MAG: hypothetical protein JSV31_31640 [Desulfobacterales bacterium]